MSARGPDGLIVPRKIGNPCLESTPARDLNRQIKWNAKTGVNVLSKTELEKVLDRQRRLRQEREREEEKEPETPFMKMLAERAKRLQQMEQEKEEDESSLDKDDDISTCPVSMRTSLFEPVSVDLKSRCLVDPKLTRKLSDGPVQPPLKRSDLRTTKSHEDQTAGAVGPLSSTAASDRCWDGISCVRSRGCPAGNGCLMSRSCASNSCLTGGASSCHKGQHWEGNSSGNSSKSSSPEPEFFKVFAQLRGSKRSEN